MLKNPNKRQSPAPLLLFFGGFFVLLAAGVWLRRSAKAA
jgi:hypothetical protein